jgi:hypothetical protein
VLALVALQMVVLTSTPKKVKVAIPDMHVAGGVSADSASLLTDVVAKAITDVRPGGDRIQVITSSMMASVLGLERQKQLLGCKDDSSCLVEVGNALGADLLISASVGKLGNTYLLSLTLIDLAKSQPDKVAQRTPVGPEDVLVKAAQEAGAEIGHSIVDTRVKALDEALAAKQAKEAAEAAASAPARPANLSPTGTTSTTVATTSASANPNANASANPAATFPGAVPGFPYQLFPAPKLDPEAGARYLRSHH